MTNANVAVVVVDALSLLARPLARTPNLQAHPFVAVAELPIVTTPAQDPVVPLIKVPPVAPPVRDVPEQVLVLRVKVVPAM